MASPLRSLSRGASAAGVSLGAAVTPRSAQGAALARAASNHSIRSVSSGVRTPKTPVTPRTPRTPNNAFFSPSTGAVAGYASTYVAAACARREESWHSGHSEPNSPERHAQLLRHHELPILLGQAAAAVSPPSSQPRSVHFQEDLDSFARSTREMVMSRQRARKERKEMLDKAMRENAR
ncbi:unnamed protein product [Durusdinium trenchii]|uniref:Uncharacterized protein n=1 Tax=Durusdinium trenchii TaxID=1381693 RepID=A0ABP0JYE5_9DINO